MDYGLSADVFSFGLLFWQAMSLKVPFDNFSHDQHFERVIKKQRRPNPKAVSGHAPDSLRKMMIDCWSTYPKNRPSFELICEMLQMEICAMRYRVSGVNENILNVMNRSDHLLDRSIASKIGSDTSSIAASLRSSAGHNP